MFFFFYFLSLFIYLFIYFYPLALVVWIREVSLGCFRWAVVGQWPEADQVTRWLARGRGDRRAVYADSALARSRAREKRLWHPGYSFISVKS